MSLTLRFYLLANVDTAVNSSIRKGCKDFMLSGNGDATMSKSASGSGTLWLHYGGVRSVVGGRRSKRSSWPAKGYHDGGREDCR